uniref:Uncharacterized protein n=1 Tax=Rheinheimera sp. BAL341 TaxID=1708203 RepID=A0A486XG34_9GAMM
MFVGAFLQRYELACELLPVLNYPQLTSNVYAADELSSEQAQRLNGFIEAAYARISQVYGKPTSTPRFVITNSIERAVKWGANNTASMHRMPWRSCIVIGPNGHNSDVIAHEWLHAEIQHRVGFLRFLEQIPVWFDEGAALTVDYRAPFLPKNIRLTEADIAAVKQLTTGRRFFAHNAIQHYQAARLAVGPLIEPAQFYHNLQRVSAGEPFDSVFLSSDTAKQ